MALMTTFHGDYYYVEVQILPYPACALPTIPGAYSFNLFLGCGRRGNEFVPLLKSPPPIWNGQSASFFSSTVTMHAYADRK